MPLPIKRIRKATADNALSVLILTSEVTKQIADIMQFPPAQAAAGVLLLVFETIQKIQTNREGCYRLAQRCLAMLVDIRDHMSDRWDSAPPSLLKAISRFEETLKSIHKFMLQEADQKWGARLIRKSTIETSMKQYHTALDDASRSFQIATLINIHLAVGEAPSRPKDAEASTSAAAGANTGGEAREPTLPPYPTGQEVIVSDVIELCTSPVSRSETTDSFSNIDTMSTMSLPSSGEYEIINSPETEEDLRITEHHGFNQYHQSQFRMKAKSRIKSGWWAGGIEGDIDGRNSMMIPYEGDRPVAMKRWMRDVKMLQNLYHPNLPQMVGYSNDETPTPFILLANVQTRLPQAMLLDAVKNSSLAACTHLLLRFYQDTLDAALYLQRQRDLSESKLQDYIEASDFRIDAEQTVVMGLPPPEVDNIVSWRNFGLAHSIRSVYLNILPNRGYAREPFDTSDDSTSNVRQRKVNHLTMLARALLPDSDNLEVVKKRLQSVLRVTEEEDEEAEVLPLTLRQIRKAAFAADVHNQSWFRNNIPPHKFSVGDLGYVPKGGADDWADFVVCCNVLEDGLAKFETSNSATGKQGMWANRGYERQDIPPFELPGGVHGWPVAVLPEAELDIYVVGETLTERVNQAWDCLLDAGRALAKKHGVAPEELILITRVGTEQRFKVRDLRRIQYWPANMGMPAFPHHQQHSFAHQPFGHQPFGQQQGMRVPIPHQDLGPKIFYLFTSGEKSFQSHFSERPMPIPPAAGEEPSQLDANRVKCFAYPTATYGFLDYVQLHAEDFAD
ncbi:uncharacterized protein TRAVEDRAFT_49473 [Trametes versicolor FP-101664 SS1]|uniref:uncharacterized protein n=1 Tax=Trametes versicolor (strain FP-101664) TaxID=717944 RepID=UPI0004621EC0|nr:uncharacterized protein TRAVEDRAFT_49473 [Trametes versicolor FP-101664 SS1]EIW56653.1 hypothetical protein TRAVEDRAFT_49473 [Trametes versicolor FP-101664 SS1]